MAQITFIFLGIYSQINEYDEARVLTLLCSSLERVVKLCTVKWKWALDLSLKIRAQNDILMD